MVPISRSMLLMAGLFAYPLAGAVAQPPVGETTSKTTPSRPGEPASGPTGPSAVPTTTKSTGEKVDSGAMATSTAGSTGKKAEAGSSTGPSSKQPQ